MFRSENIRALRIAFLENVLLSMLSVLLVILSFPPFDYGWLIWIALVPIMIVCRRLSAVHSFVFGLLSGAGMAIGIFWWIFNVPGFRYFHAIPAATYVGLYAGVWCAGIPATRRLRVPLVVSAPAMWVALDFLKAHAGFLSLPWASLAHSQHNYPVVLQISSVTGEYGITFLIVAVNAAVAACFFRSVFKQQILAAVLLGGSIIFGVHQLSQDDTSDTHRIAV
ncbi:MAG TPA: hypothetical protein VHO84_01535, partial [Syntrophorhabdaceae bacterium]|nr:hypothetical protein [Syntrophorhabdaceae bacterium]